MSDAEMTDMTVGSFLREKAGNMQRWLAEEGCVVTLPASESLLVVMAQELHREYAGAIEQRDFTALDGCDLPAQLQDLLTIVRGQAHLHDKFWRYLKLFSDVVSVPNE